MSERFHRKIDPNEPSPSTACGVTASVKIVGMTLDQYEYLIQERAYWREAERDAVSKAQELELACAEMRKAAEDMLSQAEGHCQDCALIHSDECRLEEEPCLLKFMKAWAQTFLSSTSVGKEMLEHVKTLEKDNERARGLLRQVSEFAKQVEIPVKTLSEAGLRRLCEFVDAIDAYMKGGGKE